MYDGARTSGQGSTKKRRRRPRKKNPSPVTWIMIAGGVAVATGAGIGIYAYRKRKKGALPPGPGPGPAPSPTNGGRRPSGKVNAPQFPYTAAEARPVEANWAMAFVAENCDPSVGELQKSVDAISDLAFNEMYSLGRKIPKKSDRGSGWQPYIDSWLRIRAFVREQAAAQGCET